MGCGLPLHPCWLDILYERANGYSYDAVKIFCSRDGEIIEAPYVEHVPPDVTACIFWLKNRRPQDWRDVSGISAASATVAWRRLAAGGCGQHDKGSGVTGALMAAFSPQECANYVWHPAKALGLTIPETFLTRADEVIE